MFFSSGWLFLQGSFAKLVSGTDVARGFWLAHRIGEDALLSTSGSSDPKLNENNKDKEDLEHHPRISHPVYSPWQQQKKKKSWNRIKAICMIKELARGGGGGHLIMVFIMQNAAETFVFALLLHRRLDSFLAALAPFVAVLLLKYTPSL